MIIEFNKTANIFGVMGGNPYLKNLSDWPLNEKGQRMIHFFTLFSIIYAGGQFDERYCISIYLDNETNERGQLKRGFSRRYAIQDNDGFATSKQYAKALLLEKSKKPVAEISESGVLPVITMSKRHFTDEEVMQESNEEGTDKSKLFSLPHFLQDDVHPQPAMKYQPILQLNEYDLTKLHKEYEGVFLNGLAYFWIDQNYRKYMPVKDAGYFGIQYL
ncbi:MAG: DUF1963 domain-containing protein [Chryseobacterium sp.]|nr:DUF1963 domain-containing protein [Chryseobacterium sp.]